MGDVLIDAPTASKAGPKPTVRLVATAGAADGRGHVGRALALAESLRALGTGVELELERGALAEVEAERARRIGVELISSGSAVRPGAPVVVDVPHLAPTTERFDPARLVVFDDRDAFTGRAAVAIQPGLAAWTGRGMVGRVLAGYDYIPLAQRYRRLREATAETSAETVMPGTSLRVVACFGGSDPGDVTARMAPVLIGGDGWSSELIVGSSYRGEVDDRTVTVIRDPADLPERLAQADVALIGAGTMKFEVACLGRPSVLLAIADDQLVVGPAFGATGAAEYLGDGRILAPEVVRDAITRLAADAARRRAMSRIARDIVDGRGAARIAIVVLELAG